ncbi:MAG: hypothetical protein ACREMB_22960, partial [Candidatus Rokuibacteriota bacterium]
CQAIATPMGFSVGSAGGSRTLSPVRLAIEEFEVSVPVPAYVFTHDKGVIEVRVEQTAPASQVLWLQADAHIEGGTSGGPVVTRDGRLRGIISHSGSVLGETRSDGSIPRVHLTAPLWLVRQMVSRGTRRTLDAAIRPARGKR